MSRILGRALPCARQAIPARQQLVSRTYSSRPASARALPRLAIFAGFTAALAVSSFALGSGPVRAESLAPGPGKQDLLPKKEPKDGYATKEETLKAIEVLRGKLREDQVTVDEDELLGHGHSANTYHCKRHEHC
jgi:D-lactate dehydrogenase (cytochrome)